MGPNDSTGRRYRFSALATGMVCLQAFTSQFDSLAVFQISQRFGLNPASAFRVCGYLIDPGFLQRDDRKLGSREHLKRRSAKIPLGRLGQTAEVVAAMLFLASRPASYIRGATLDVNGGLAMA